MSIDLDREILISQNLRFFESSLNGIAARQFFIEAVRCSEPQPGFFLAGVTCLLHGIEGALSNAINEVENNSNLPEDHPMDRGEHKNLKNWTLKRASKLGFNVEALAFPDERGKMKERVVDNNHPVGIVQFRNEFSHGIAYRATENFGGVLISDPVLLAPHFKDLLTLSYGFVIEVDRFRGRDFNLPVPQNPFEY